jgi:hypothetical protein
MRTDPRVVRRLRRRAGGTAKFDLPPPPGQPSFGPIGSFGPIFSFAPIFSFDPQR